MGMLDEIKAVLMGGAGGGQLQKGRLVVTEEWAGGFQSIAFLYNPETVTVVKKAQFKEHQTQGSDAGRKEWTHGVSRSLTISELYFDTYETRANVRDMYVSKLEKLVHRDPKLKRPPKVIFVWGAFMNESSDYNANQWFVTSITVKYTMFLNDGRPVRAKVTLELKETQDQGGQSQGGGGEGQHSVHTLQMGESLQDISSQLYGDSSQWRQIADANGIDNPTDLAPGTQLKIPPKK